MDTSSLISLKIIDMLEPAAENIEITTTHTVAEELEEISRTSDKEGKAAEEILDMISKEKIQEREIKSKDELDDIISNRVEKGEASCFICCQEEEISNLIMDDIEAASSLEGRAINKGIQQKISAAVIVELIKKNIITEKEAEKAINKLKESRNWKGGVLEVLADKYLSNK